jgi:hypothetical protein
VRSVRKEVWLKPRKRARKGLVAATKPIGCHMLYVYPPQWADIVTDVTSDFNRRVRNPLWRAVQRGLDKL